MELGLQYKHFLFKYVSNYKCNQQPRLLVSKYNAPSTSCGHFRGKINHKSQKSEQNSKFLAVAPFPTSCHDHHDVSRVSSMLNSLRPSDAYISICVSNLTIIGSDNGLSPGRRQAIIWTNAGILLIGSLETKFSEILIKIHTSPFKKMHLKLSSGKCRPSCLGLNVLTIQNNQCQPQPNYLNFRPRSLRHCNLQKSSQSW